ncbi:putative ribonuclease H-like domain-containing protein [Tanacetum coccineum]|uniref:Ribonuclease H-like domain-containing protein n=1 Tax=Tanacetum coccineum TaxID=301880 RepID=A0ABQ5ELQ0_9ASTR
MDYPQRALQNKGIVDSGCSRHMTGNKAYLAEYQDFNGGPVAFGGSKGYITGKGKIKTGKLDFEDVCFVKELQHFNLFSVSQMCDKKNKVLFTDSECLVLSPEFKLPDENQVLLRIPRQNNMYSFNLENIVPSGGLACLIAKATIDESNKWHRRLGHVNFKNLNKLVKGNLVRGLPSKIFQNDHTCVACQKGKQHKASCKAKSVSSISQPLQLLHMDLFGPTSVRSLNHKTYCLVITDDFSRSENQANKHACPKEANHNVGTKDNIDAGDSEIEAEFAQDYFVLPIWSSYTSTVKSSKAMNAGEEPNKHPDLKTDEKLVDKEDQVFLDELERLKRQEQDANDAAEALKKEFAQDTEDLLIQAGAAKASSTNIVNTASTPVSTASPYGGLSFTDTDQDDSEIPALKDMYDHPTDELEMKVGSDAMQEELLQFKIQKVWILIDLPYGKKAIGTKWVYRNKKDERGVVVRNKVRLVAQEHRQEEGIDYDEVFAPMARIEAIRIFLAFPSYMGFIVYQMDVKSAFLYGKIDEEVYVFQPPSFVDPKYPKKVYKVVKALYGLHQAPRAWYATLSTFLLKSGYRRGTIDKTLFIKKDKNDIMLVQVYVDDIIFGSTKRSWCDEFEASIKSDLLFDDADGIDRLYSDVFGFGGNLGGHSIQCDRSLSGVTNSSQINLKHFKARSRCLRRKPNIITHHKAGVMEGVSMKQRLAGNKSLGCKSRCKRILVTEDASDMGRIKLCSAMKRKESEKRELVLKIPLLARDEEVARRVQEDWEAEEEVKKLAEEEATKIKFLHDTIVAQRRFLAQQRFEAIRNKPPSRNQLRNQMMTYLKHVGGKKHSDPKTKGFEEIKVLYDKIKRSDDSFIAIGSVEDEKVIKEINEQVVDASKKRVKKDDSIKVEIKEEE